MKPLGVLIRGPGWVAGEHIKEFRDNPHTEVRVLSGRNPGRAAAYKEQFALDCDLTEDYESQLLRDDIAIVSVCTINYLHYREAKLALEAGKHVLLEKPMAFSMEEARDLVNCARRVGVKTLLSHVARWYPQVVEMKRRIDVGEIGALGYVEVDYWHEVIGTWKTRMDTSGSSLLMGGCHAVDMARHLLGCKREVVEVFGYSIPPQRRKDFEFDPTQVIIFRFADGAVGKVSTSIESNMPYVFHIHALGTNGAVRNGQIYVDKGEVSKEKQFEDLPGIPPDSPDVTHHPFSDEIGDFVDGILNDRRVLPDFEDAAKTYEIIFAAEEAFRSGQPVSLPLS